MLVVLAALGLFLAGRAWFDAVERRHRSRGLETPTTIEELRQEQEKHNK